MATKAEENRRRLDVLRAGTVVPKRFVEGKKAKGNRKFARKDKVREAA